jgi:hypothetical protein
MNEQDDLQLGPTLIELRRTMNRKLRRGMFRLRLVSGFSLADMCLYYGFAHRYTVLIPWALCLVFFMLWQLRIGKPEETASKHKVRRY